MKLIVAGGIGREDPVGLALSEPVNLAAPQPLPQREFMNHLRR